MRVMECGYQTLQSWFKYFRNLNLFPSTPPSTDEYELRTQVITTRVFIITMVTSLGFLVMYISTVFVVKSLTVESPSLEEYSMLYGKYPKTITCPCTDVSIAYERFLIGSYQLHPICSSYFVTDEWILHFQRSADFLTWRTSDFRRAAAFLFQSLVSFCQLAEKTITNKLLQFIANEYTSTDLTPESLFRVQLNSLVQQFELSTANDFISSLRTVMDIVEANMFYSSIQLNADFVSYPQEIYYATVPKNYDNCSCEITSTCAEVAGIYNSYDAGSQQLLYAVRGMKVGCYLIEALWQSNLQCFFDADCIGQLVRFVDRNDFNSNIQLNSSALIHFSTNSTVYDLVKNSMVEQWTWSLNYSIYFKECHPFECMFTMKTTNDVMYVVTTLIGLIGGLITSFKFVVPTIVDVLRKKKIKRERKIVINLRTIITKCIKYFQDFNLFISIPPATDNHELKTQIISTRVFIFTLSILTAILFIYISTLVVNKTYRIKLPILEQYSDLYGKYLETLTCPCTQISIEHRKFVSVQYTLHQICSSVFVTDSWIRHMENTLPEVNLVYHDFRLTGSYLFRALKTFCSIANRTILNNLVHFGLENYAHMKLTPQILFENQLNSSIQKFQSSLLNEFLSTLEAIRRIEYANGLFSAIQSNYRLYSFSSNTYVTGYSPRLYGNCSCSDSSICVTNATISTSYVNRSSRVLYILPGLLVGCYVIEALLQSNLNCFFNGTCVRRLSSYVKPNVSFDFTELDSSLLIRFSTHDTVSDLVQQLMVEQWKWSINYADYFSECNPLECTYVINTKTDNLYIVTTLIGLVGGLVTALKLAVPRLMNLIRIKGQSNGTRSEINLTLVINKCLIFIENFNLFPSISALSNEHQLRKQIVSTRIFIVLLVSSTLILFTYVSTVTINKTFTVHVADLNQYLELYDEQSETLTCPCTQTSIEYNKFINVSFTLHQVCTSVFISLEWIAYLFNSLGLSDFYSTDFRVSGPFAFQAIRSFCILVNDTIRNNLDRFNRIRHVNKDLMTRILFEEQLQIPITQFQLKTINDFMLSLENVRTILQGNSILSYTRSNALLAIFPSNAMIYTYFIGYNGCSCAYNSQCFAQVGIYAPYDNNHWLMLYSVPGMLTGCYVVDGLLKSNLQCFFDMRCFNILRFLINSTMPSNIKVMDASNLIRFAVNDTIYDLVKNLMVEEWKWSLNYSLYFNECRPFQCTFTLKTKNDAIYIVTTLIGLVGGLVTVFKLLVPPFVSIIYFIRQKRSQTMPSVHIRY